MMISSANKGLDKQVFFILRESVTKGLPAGGDYGFIPGPDAWESYMEGGSLMQQKRPCRSSAYFK